MALRKIVKTLYDNSILGGFLFKPVKKLYDFYRYYLLSEKAFLKQTFKRILGYSLNLKSPKSFNEKIQWLKLNDRKPRYRMLADKYAVRAYIEKTIGSEYLIPLLFSTENADDLVPENMPDEPHIIKTNHYSGRVRIVQSKDDFDYAEARSHFKKELKKSLYRITKEWQYKDLTPRILVEKLLVDEKGDIPENFKYHCFGGVPSYVQVDISRHEDYKKNIYDMNWELQDFTWNGRPHNPAVEKPAQFDEMTKLATVLCQNMPYVRVDFYNVKGKVFFSEITFHPASGFAPFEPREWDYKLGSLIDLNNQNSGT